MGEAQTEIMQAKECEKFRFQAQIIQKHVRLMTKSKRKKFQEDTTQLRRLKPVILNFEKSIDQAWEGTTKVLKREINNTNNNIDTKIVRLREVIDNKIENLEQ